LRGLIAKTMNRDPLEGDVFVFSNRARNRIRLYHFDRSGQWVATKKLEQGTFLWTRDSEGAAEVNLAQLKLLLDGFELKSRKGWYRR